MNGLFDPKMMGLLGASAGLLQASGPSTRPVSLGQAMGQGLQGGLLGYQQGMSMQDMELKRKLALQRQGQVDSFARTLPEDQRERFLLDPEGYLKATQPKPQEPYTLGPGAMRFGQDGQIIAQAPMREQPQSDLARLISERDRLPANDPVRAHYDAAISGQSSTARSAAPYFSPVQTGQGLMAFDARTGRLQPLNLGGRPVVGSASDPTLQGDLAEAKAGGKERGESQAQSSINLPATVSKAEQAIGLIDQLVGSEDGMVKEHPGFQSGVGMRIPGLGMIPGTDTSSFNALLDQVKGGAFLEAFNSLKGGGQITEVEGKKATDAITRMNKAQSEAEFIKAAREFQSVIRGGIDRAKQKAGRHTGPERRGVPQGVDPALWAVMTPEERALWH